MSIVWITQWSAFDFGPATKYGSLMPVVAGEIDIEDVDRMVVLIDEFVMKFDPANDYLILTGEPTVMSVMFSNAMQAADGEDMPLRVLKWDRDNRTYRVVSLDPANYLWRA